MPPKKNPALPLPSYLPDPDTCSDVVNMPVIVERMLVEIKTALGHTFAVKPASVIGDKGWSAPFNVDQAFTALTREGFYQAAINVFILKLLGNDDNALNYRNVKYLADYYFKATAAMTEAGSFRLQHFPHALHAWVRDPSEIRTAWNWGIFEKFVGTEVLLAYCFSLCCQITRSKDKKSLEPWIQTALTSQCKFHVHQDRAMTISAKMQYTENVSADFKALGFSALQEAEHILTIINLIRLSKPGEARILNAEIAAKIHVHRAVAAETGALAGVSAADVDPESPTKAPKPGSMKAGEEVAARMLDITIKVARVLLKYPALRMKLRLLEQRWGRECLCDSAAKLEKVIQLCGGADSIQLGENMNDVIDGVNIMLKRGGVPGGPAKITTAVLTGNPKNAQLGLIDRFLKRKALARYLIEKFPMQKEQGNHVMKFASFEAYDKAVPPAAQAGNTLDLTWLALRTPACAALTNFLRLLWDGELDEAIKSAMKAVPNATCALDWINAVDDLKKHYAHIDSEFQLMVRASAGDGGGDGAKPGGVSAPGANDAKKDDEDADPAKMKLKQLAALRRAEVISLQIGASSVNDLVGQMKSSTPGSLPGKFGKQHVSIWGDFGALPDVTTRPWIRPPCYVSAVASAKMEAGKEVFNDPDVEHFLQMYFDGSRQANQGAIRKLLDDGSDDSLRAFFIQNIGRGSANAKHRGVGSAGDVENMMVKTRRPMNQIKKKSRNNYGGDTASVLYRDVKKPSWQSLTQVTLAEKSAIFDGSCPTQTGASLDSTKWLDKSAKKKNKIPKAARNVLPLSWWERDMKFNMEVLDNFNVVGVIDLFGSVNLALACLNSEPPRPYLGLLRNATHLEVFQRSIDTFIMREIGREGPPPSKFFIAEMKDEVAKHYPALVEPQVSDDSDDDVGESDDETGL